MADDDSDGILLINTDKFVNNNPFPEENSVVIPDLETTEDLNAALEKRQIQELDISRCILLCFTCILSLGLITFCLLWLAESQYSLGVLRPRYLNEPCDNNKTCVKGLHCDWDHRCRVIPPPCSPYTDYYHYNNSLVNNTIYYCPPKTCAPCPTCPPPVISKLVSYFDFNEFPNYWIDPGPQGFYDHSYNIAYGGCKEICGRDATCQGICYNGLAKLCWRMAKNYPVPVTPIYNNTYICAMKTFI